MGKMAIGWYLALDCSQFVRFFEFFFNILEFFMLCKYIFEWKARRVTHGKDDDGGEHKLHVLVKGHMCCV